MAYENQVIDGKPPKGRAADPFPKKGALSSINFGKKKKKKGGKRAY